MLAKVVNAQGEAAGTSYTSQKRAPGTAVPPEFCVVNHPELIN